MFPGVAFGVLFSSGEVANPSVHRFETTVVVSMPIPMDRSLIGMSFYRRMVQAVTALGATESLSLSRGGHGVIGP